MSITTKTIQIYLRENLKSKGLFFGTIGLWTSGMILQKLLMPLVIAHAFQQLVKLGSTDSLSWSPFIKDIAIFITIALAAQFCIDYGLVVLSRLEAKVMPRLHEMVYRHLMSQSMQFHSDTFSGSLVTQANRFVNAYVSLTDTFVINFLQLFVLIVLSSIVILFYSPLIAAVMITWSIFFIWLNFKLTKKRIKFSKIAAAADTVLTGHLADTVTNVGVIKSFSSEQSEAHEYTRLAKDRSAKKYTYWMQAVKNDATFGVMMTLLQVAVLVLSIWGVQNQTISIGILVLSQIYMTQIIANLWGLSGIARNIEQNLSDAAEMTEILEVKPRILDPETPTQFHPTVGEIHFECVDFGYSDDTKNTSLFKQLDVSIKAGEKIGLVGPSGGGKTTITKLLLRFMDIQQGAIKIDGQDISQVTQNDLRRAITYVPQEPLLFHRTLAENIAYGKLDATQAQIESAAKKAHAHEFISQLPHGYETLVGERGVKLSGGQRQRVAIARAMIKDAPILVLDEATSALDSESERLIQDALWKLMEGRTTLVIAHRLSTIQHMDRIIVLDKGTVVEQGTHAELLTQKHGLYAKLWAHQSGGFLED